MVGSDDDGDSDGISSINSNRSVLLERLTQELPGMSSACLTTAANKTPQVNFLREYVYVQEEIPPSCTVEETCTVYVQEEDVKMEDVEIKGKL